MTDVAIAAAVLAYEEHEPPDECWHGFVLPRDCPNPACWDRLREWAWYVGRGQDPEFVPTPGDHALLDDVRAGRVTVDQAQTR